MADLLLVLWVALAGADRVDLLAGRGPVWGTPFLALTPIFLGVEAVRLFRRRGRLRLTRGVGAYGIVVGSLIGIAVISVFLSHDAPASARRLALLVAQAVAGLVVAARLAAHPEPGRLLVRAAGLGIVLATLSNVGQLAWFVADPLVGPSRARVVDLAPISYGTFYPRLSGLAVDANRGPFQVLVFAFLLFRFASRSRWRGVLLALAAFAVVLSVSRSAWLAAAAGGAVALASSRSLRLSPVWLAAGASAAVLASALLLALPRAAEAAAALGEVVMERFSIGEASGQLHVRLIERAVELVTADAKVAMVGTGYGTAEHFVQDFFPGDPYGNFHSLYFSFLVETGVFGLVAVVALLVGAALRSRGWLPMIAAVVAFNVFYQLQAEPLFWFVLAAAWLRLGGPTGAPVPAAVHAPTPFPAATPEPVR